jgi:hypothetical protein
MKPINHLVVGALAALLITAPIANAWPWSDDTKQLRLDEEIQRRVEAEQKLNVQEVTAGRWRIAAFVFATGCIVFLLVGTTLGSKGRQHAEERR